MFRKIFFVLLIIHSIVTIYVLQKTGYTSVLPPFQELYVYQIFSDLSVSSILILIFLNHERNKKQKPLLPFVICTAGLFALGSLAPLVYLILNKEFYNEKFK